MDGEVNHLQRLERQQLGQVWWSSRRWSILRSWLIGWQLGIIFTILTSASHWWWIMVILLNKYDYGECCQRKKNMIMMCLKKDEKRKRTRKMRTKMYLEKRWKKKKNKKNENKDVPRESAAAPQRGAQGRELRSTVSAPVTQRTTTIGLIFLFRLLFVLFKFYKQGKSDNQFVRLWKYKAKCKVFNFRSNLC